MLDGDDRVEKPEGICAEAVSPEHPVVNGFSDYPVFLDITVPSPETMPMSY